jgi:hypothetical protein
LTSIWLSPWSSIFESSSLGWAFDTIWILLSKFWSASYSDSMYIQSRMSLMVILRPAQFKWSTILSFKSFRVAFWLSWVHHYLLSLLGKLPSKSIFELRSFRQICLSRTSTVV